MKEDWIMIYSTKGGSRAKVAKSVLRQNGIECHILQKKDAIYPMFGESKLYAPSTKAAKARQLLQANNLRAKAS